MCEIKPYESDAEVDADMIDGLNRVIDRQDAKIESDAKVIAALREALEPFAQAARAYERSDREKAQHYRDERGQDYNYPPSSDYQQPSGVTLGHCRKARWLLAASEQTAGESK